MEYVRVTEVLSKYQDWSIVDHKKLKACAERGTILHLAITSHIKNLWYDLPKDLMGYFESFMTWFEIMVNEIIFVERRFYDDINGYTGKIDCGAILKNDEHATIIDWKTSLNKQKVWEGQMAAYLSLAQKNLPAFLWERCISIQLKKDGKPAKVIEYTNNLNAFWAFLSALNAHKYFIG